MIGRAWVWVKGHAGLFLSLLGAVLVAILAGRRGASPLSKATPPTTPKRDREEGAAEGAAAALEARAETAEGRAERLEAEAKQPGEFPALPDGMTDEELADRWNRLYPPTRHYP